MPRRGASEYRGWSKGGHMTVKPEEFLVQAWRKQLDTGLRVIETITEGATKIHEAQLEAATDAHADAEATRKAMAAATDAAQLFRLQAEWARANVAKSAAYWHSLYQIVAETGTELAKCLYSQAAVMQEGLKAEELDASKQALFGLLDNAYKQWLDATRQFYKLPAIPAEPKRERRAAA
jgi:phasin family protein